MRQFDLETWCALPWLNYSIFKVMATNLLYIGRNSYQKFRFVSNTMATTTPQPNFPLFAPMRVMNCKGADHHSDEDYDWIMCLWRTSSKSDDFCEIPCGNFTNFIIHLKNEHGIELQDKKDFCSDCSTIFQSCIEGVNHYLEKALLYQDFKLELSTEESPNSGKFLEPIF